MLRVLRRKQPKQARVHGLGDTVAAQVSRCIDSDLPAIFEMADDASVRRPGRLHVRSGTSLAEQFSAAFRQVFCWDDFRSFSGFLLREDRTPVLVAHTFQDDVRCLPSPEIPVAHPRWWLWSIAFLGNLMFKFRSIMSRAAAVVSASVSGMPCSRRQFRLEYCPCESISSHSASLSRSSFATRCPIAFRLLADVSWSRLHDAYTLFNFVHDLRLRNFLSE